MARKVLSFILSGHPTPDDIITTPTPPDAAQSASAVVLPEREKIQKLTVETTKGDIRMWTEVLRNLMKDIPGYHSINLPEGILTAGRTQLSPRVDRGQEGGNSGIPPDEVRSSTNNGIAAFSCGHAHPIDRFLNKIVPEFVERVHSFPLPLPRTLRVLQQYYRQAASYPCACPHCVFLYLRKFQLEACPRVPISPWSM